MAGMNEEQGGASGSGFDARLTLIVYVRVLSVVFLLSGLQNWARLIGLTPADGDFLALPTSVVVATLFFAVADLVAAVGLWLLASWGTVVWMICALTETALHGAFTYALGSVFRRHFAQGGNFVNFDAKETKGYFRERYEDFRARKVSEKPAPDDAPVAA